MFGANKKTEDSSHISSRGLFDYQKVSKLLVFLLIFLVPIFFLPSLGRGSLGISKQILFTLLIFPAILLLLLKQLISKKITFNWAPVHIPVILFIGVVGLSTLFSIWPYQSFWGFYSTVGVSFLSLALFALFYFLVTNLFNQKKDSLWGSYLLVFSLFIAVLVSIAQISGKFVFSWDFTKFASFNSVGSINLLSLIVAAILPLVLILVSLGKKLFKLSLIPVGIIFLGYLFLTNLRIAWFVLLVGIIFVFSLEIINIEKRKISTLVSSGIILAIAFLFIIFEFPLPFLPSIPAEVSIAYGTELDIAKQSLREGLLLGSGPSTFTYDFLKYKPQALNQTMWWNTRFANGSSEILDRLITTGVLGIIAFFLLLISFLKTVLKRIELESSLKWGLLSSFISLIVIFFIYPANFVLMFIFWFLMSTLINLIILKQK